MPRRTSVVSASDTQPAHVRHEEDQGAKPSAVSMRIALPLDAALRLGKLPGAGKTVRARNLWIRDTVERKLAAASPSEEVLPSLSLPVFLSQSV